jgi:hypothetical protein
MPMYIRPRSTSKAFELRVTHKRLDKPGYASLDTREAAEALGNRTLAALERGKLPEWLREPARRECKTVADLVRDFLNISEMAGSTQDVLDNIAHCGVL